MSSPSTPRIKIFLDTPILRYAFIANRQGKNWREELQLLANAELITSYKCVAEMYGILKTSLLDNELVSYGSESSKRLRDRIFKGDDFLSIVWHRQILENLHWRPGESTEQGRRLAELQKWRRCYEQIRNDFEDFLRHEHIKEIHCGVLFAQHEWQAKLHDLARETLIPSEDLEIVLSAWFAKADIFLTEDKELIRFSFSLPWEPDIPAFCRPQELRQKIDEKQNKVPRERQEWLMF